MGLFFALDSGLEEFEHKMESFGSSGGNSTASGGNYENWIMDLYKSYEGKFKSIRSNNLTSTAFMTTPSLLVEPPVLDEKWIATAEATANAINQNQDPPAESEGKKL